MTSWPNLYILGAPKCGTTSIAGWLAQHSDIFMCEPKEPSFFNDDYKDGPFRGRKTAYLKLFSKAKNVTWMCDGTVDYLASDVAVKQIMEVAVAPKFIVVVRKHADLLMSMHQQECVSGNELIYDFALAFKLSSERRNGRKLPITQPEYRKIDYEMRAEVGLQIRKISRYISRERLLLIDFEILQSDSDLVWSKICDFLDVEFEQVDLVHSNARVDISSRPAIILRKLLRNIKWKIGASSNFGLDRIWNKFSIKTSKRRPVIDVKLRAMIEKRYEQDVDIIKAYTLDYRFTAE